MGTAQPQYTSQPGMSPQRQHTSPPHPGYGSVGGKPVDLRYNQEPGPQVDHNTPKRHPEWRPSGPPQHAPPPIRPMGPSPHHRQADPQVQDSSFRGCWCCYPSWCPAYWVEGDWTQPRHPRPRPSPVCPHPSCCHLCWIPICWCLWTPLRTPRTPRCCCPCCCWGSRCRGGIIHPNSFSWTETAISRPNYTLLTVFKFSYFV